MLQHLGLTDAGWVSFVASQPGATAFHQPGWASLLADCYGYRPFALAWLDASENIVAGLPVLEVNNPIRRRRWVSLPFTDHCPVLPQECPPAGMVPALVREVLARGISLEIRGEFGEGSQVARSSDAVLHTLQLADDPESLRRGFSKMHQRNIRQAQRAGVEIRCGSSPSEMQAFYRLHVLTRRRLGVPVQPQRFFRGLADRLDRDRLGLVLSAYLDGAPIAAAVFLAWGRTLIYKYGASDTRAWHARPNNLLFWTAIQWGCEHGYRVLDLGRTDWADSGLREFKKGWGAEEKPLLYSIIGAGPIRSAGLMSRRLAPLIRRSPPWVCRVLGELLYRYVA